MGSVYQIYAEGHEKWLPEDAPLWRYVPLKTLFFYLTGSVFIPSIATLRQGDPFEGLFPCKSDEFESALRERCGDQFDTVRQWVRERLWTQWEKDFIGSNPGRTDHVSSYNQNHFCEFLWKTRFAWCWFQSELESAAMWNSYGKEGITIGTTVGSIGSALTAI